MRLCVVLAYANPLVQVGQALTLGESTYPWYVYGGGLAVLAGLVNLAASVATELIDSLDDDAEEPAL